MSDQFIIEWRDAGKEPKVQPNPRYPTGIDLDVSEGRPSCMTSLPYPAKRIGMYLVWCQLCGASIGCTTAGRPDDPRSVRFACKKMAASA